MSLEALRAQVEEEETKANQPEPEEEPEEVEASEPETEEDEAEEPEEAAEESDDFELELEGEPEPDQQKYDPVEVLQHKLSRERKKKREARTEVDELRDQVKQLTTMMQGGQQPQQAQPQSQSAEPKIPDLYDQGIDGDRDKYDRAMKQWFQNYQTYQNRHSEAEQAQSKNQERLTSMTKALAERAAKFSKENKVSVDRVADALDKATSEIDESTGKDGALAYLLDSVGDGGERVAYYIGTNNSAMSQMKGLLRDDPTGFKAIAHMTRLAEKLKPKHSRKVSKAPEPDQPLRGDSSKTGKSASKLQSEWNKAKTTDEMMKVRRKAREMGVKLDI